MYKLALTLEPSRFEPPTVYLSRLAARNHSDDLQSFCFDLGISLGDVSRGIESEIRFVESIANLDAGALSPTTIVKLSSMRYTVGGETLDSQTLNRGEVRICPQCILDQLDGSREYWRISRPLHWQIPQVKSCTKHDLSLVSLGSKTNTPARFDVVSRIRAHHGALPNLMEPRPADTVDRYLTVRAYGEKDGRWTDCLTIPALWRCSEALGIVLLHGTAMRRTQLAEKPLREAFVVGFNLLHSGWEHAQAALYDFREKLALERGFQPVPQYGELQRLLAQNVGCREELEPVRDRLFASCLKHYPLAAGSKLFGRVVEKRKIHSMRSACQAAKIRREVIEEMLIDKGVGERRADGLFRQLSPLTVELVDELVVEKSQFLSNVEAANYLGIRETVFKELAGSEILQPRTGQGHWERKGYRKVDLDHFRDALMSDAPSIESVPCGIALFSDATRIVKCSTPEIADLLLNKRVKAFGYKGTERTIGNLLIDTAALSEAMPRRKANGYTLTEAAKLLKINFPTIYALQSLGYLETVRMKHAQSRMTNELIPIEALERYRKAFCSLGIIRESRPELAGLKLEDFRTLELTPVIGAPGVRYIYRWKDIPLEKLVEVVTSQNSSPTDGVQTSNEVADAASPNVKTDALA